MIFVWLALLVCIFLSLQSALVWFVLKRRYRELHRYGPLADDDVDDRSANEGDYEQANNHPLKSLKPQNGHAMIDVVNHGNNDDADSDSQIEFEQRKQYSSKI